MASDDRERSFENALARHLRPGGSHSACADAETLAAYHERSLAPEVMASLKAHVSECARCQEILAQLKATDEIPLPAADIAPAQTAAPRSGVRVLPARKPTPWRWVAPAGALAAGLLVWIAVHEGNSARLAKVPGSDTHPIEIAKSQPASPPLPTPSLDATRKSETPPPDAYSASKVEPQLQSRLQSPLGANRETGVPVPAPIQHLQSLKKEKDLPTAGKKSSSAQGVGGGSVGGVLRALSPSALEPSPKPAPPRAVAQTVEVEAAPAAVVTNQATGDELNKTEAEAKSANDKRDAPASRSPAPKPAIAGAVPPPAPIPQQTQTVEVMSEEAELKTLPMRGRDVADLATLNRNAQLLLASGGAAVTVSAPGGRLSWRIGPAGVILFSSDAGKSWLVQPSGIITDLLAGSAPSAKVCWIVGRGGTILRTTDKGKHWKKVKPPTQDDFVSVFAVNARQATVSPPSGTYQTTDGGATWNKLPPQ